MTKPSTQIQSNNYYQKGKSKADHTVKDFMPGYKKQEECFSNAKMYPFNSTTGLPDINSPDVRGFPYYKRPEQIVYENWLSSVSNPISKEFHYQKDAQGNKIVQPNGKPNAQYICNTIVRLRRSDGSEVLYSWGSIQGFNSVGELKIQKCYKPEVWTKTNFDTERFMDNNTKQMYEITKSPIGNEEVYDLEFTSENLDKLYYEHAVGVNDNRLLGAGNNDIHTCNLVVKDEKTSKAVDISWHDEKETYELFRNKSFAYLFNADYMPDAYKQNLRAKSNAILTKSTSVEGLEDEEIAPERIEDANNNGTDKIKAYS